MVSVVSLWAELEKPCKNRPRRHVGNDYKCSKETLSLAKLTAIVEPVERDFSILADLDEVAVGITHVASPFPAVID
jgi:hypothetical protein